MSVAAAQISLQKAPAQQHQPPAQQQLGAPSFSLPLSVWHVLLAWLDLVTDVLGAISTRQLALQLRSLCGMRLAAFFNCCASIQLLLLAGSILVQGALAAMRALEEERLAAAAAAASSSLGARRRAVLWALLRTATLTELAYAEFFRRSAPSSARTAAVLHMRLAELSFEGPQVVISWMVLLARLTVEELARASGEAALHVTTYTKVMQWVSVCVGVLSLALASSEFVRVHGRSFWAGPPPQALFLGLVDVSPGSWWRSAAIGAHSFTSLATRALLSISVAAFTLNVAFFDVRHNRSTSAAAAALGLHAWPSAMALQLVLPSMMVASLALNAALLLPMRHWAVLPAAVVSVFVNIPWVAAQPGSPAYDSVWATWPAWVMQGLYGGAAVAMGLLSWKGAAFMSPCHYEVVHLAWDGSVSGRGVSAAVLLPVCAAVAEALLFTLLSVEASRRKGSGLLPGSVLAAAGGAGGLVSVASLTGAGAASISGGVGPPPLAYRFRWRRPYACCTVLVAGVAAPKHLTPVLSV